MSRPFTVLTPIEARIVSALGQTMYPREGGIPIDATQARAVEYVDQWLAALPAKERVLIRLMFALFEVAMPVFGPSRLRTFTAASPEDRTEYLRAWEASRLYFRRASMFALRSVFALAYLADDEVLRRIGVEDGVEILARQRAAAEARGSGREDSSPADEPGAAPDPSAKVAVLNAAVDAVRAHDRERRERERRDAEAAARAAAGGGEA